MAANALLPSAERVSDVVPFLDKLGTDMVDILVGSDKKLFRVHKFFLCNKIDYFDKMFNGKFKEATEQKAEFPEDDPASFDILVEWVYSPDPRKLRDLVSLPKAATDRGGRASWDAVSLYSLAGRICLPDLQDLIMDNLIRYHKTANILPSADFAYRAMSQTGSDSQLSRYAIESVHYVIRSDMRAKFEDGWPTAEVERLFTDHAHFSSTFVDLCRHSHVFDPRNHKSLCEYHNHQENDEHAICAVRR